MKRFTLYFLSALALSGCGGLDKVTNANALHQAQDESTSRAIENDGLQQKISDYKNDLQHVYVSDHAEWVYVASLLSFAQAQAACADIGFEMPSASDLDEFFAQVVPKHPDWAQPPMPVVKENVQTTPQQPGPNPEIDLCRKARP